MKFFIGQINLERFPLQEGHMDGAAFWRGMDRIPIILTDCSFDDESYTFLGPIDGRSNKYRDAIFLSLQDIGMFTHRDEFEDCANRGALDWDGVMVMPKTLVERLAEPNTPEFREYIAQAEKAAAEQRQDYLDRLGSLFQIHGIPSIQMLGRVLQEMPPDIIRKLTPVTDTRMKRQQIGSDFWVTDGYTAEIASERDFPDKENLPEFDAIQKTLEIYDDTFEEAELSPLVIRRTTYNKTAVLQSKTHTTYINDDYTSMLHSGVAAYIRNAGDPVFVKRGDKITKIIMPVVLRENDGINAASTEFQELLGRFGPKPCGRDKDE